MAKYQTLIDEINGYITSNGQGDIEGADLNKVLNDIVFSLGENYSFIGKVEPTSTFVGSEGNVFAFANTAGIYTNFGGLQLEIGEKAFLTYNGTWSKITISTIAQELGDREDVTVSQKCVSEKINKLDDVFRHKIVTINKSPEYTAGVLRADGSIVENTSYGYTNLINLHPNETILLNGGSPFYKGLNVAYITRYNQDGTFLEALKLGDSTTKIETYTNIKEESIYIKICGYYHQLSYIIKDSFKFYLDIYNSFQCGKLSIIGDSISTFKNYVVDEFNSNSYYPSVDVLNIDQTYWNRLLDSSNGVLEINASQTSSCVTNCRKAYKSLCDRVPMIGNPDTVIIALGTNDSTDSVPIGDFLFDSDINSLDESFFAQAYIKGVKMIQERHSNVRIVCLIFMAIKKEYRDAIKKIANYYNLEYLDIQKFDSNDNKHPNAKGMLQIANELVNLSNRMIDVKQDDALAQISDKLTFSESLIPVKEELAIIIDKGSQYVNTSGVITFATEDYGIILIDVNKDDVVEFTCTAGSSVAVIAEYNLIGNSVPLVNSVSTGYPQINHTYIYHSDKKCTLALSGKITNVATEKTELYIIKRKVAYTQEIASIDKSVSILKDKVLDIERSIYYYKSIKYNTLGQYLQMVDGNITTTTVNTRYIYYTLVKAGKSYAFQCDNTLETKTVEWGLYIEIPSTEKTPISYGNDNRVGRITIVITPQTDSYFAVGINNSYHRNLRFCEIFTLNEVEIPTAKKIYKPSQIKYIPHRGIRNKEIPENTIHSVMYSNIYGLNYSECDVRYTSDGVGVVMHDTTINRTMCNSDLSSISENITITDNTYDTLLQYIYKSTNPAFRTKINTIREYIDSCAYWNVCPIIQGTMSDEDLAYCMQRLGDNWICYGGNFTQVRAYSDNVLCLTSNSYSNIESMEASLKAIGGNVGISRLFNNELTDDIITMCRRNNWEVMASYAYNEYDIPDAIRRGATIVLADNVGKDIHKVLKNSDKSWNEYEHNGEIINGFLSISNSTPIQVAIENKGIYKVFVEFEGSGNFSLPIYDDNGIFQQSLFPMSSNIFQYNFVNLENTPYNISIIPNDTMIIKRLIVFYE